MTKVFWNDERDAVLRAITPDTNFLEVVKELGVLPQSIYQRCEKIDVDIKSIRKQALYNIAYKNAGGYMPTYDQIYEITGYAYTSVVTDYHELESEGKIVRHHNGLYVVAKKKIAKRLHGGFNAHKKPEPEVDTEFQAALKIVQSKHSPVYCCGITGGDPDEYQLGNKIVAKSHILKRANEIKKERLVANAQ